MLQGPSDLTKTILIIRMSGGKPRIRLLFPKTWLVFCQNL